jgi:hypothetical protein
MQGMQGRRKYTLRVINGSSTWRIYQEQKQEQGQEQDQNKNQKNQKNAEQMLEDYYFNEDVSNIKKLPKGQGIQKSFPQHHCLMRASLSSAQSILDDKCLHRSYATTAATCMHLFHPERIDSTCAVARVHSTNKENNTPFTKLTAHQKKYLIAQSGMAGLLVSRLFGVSFAKPHTIKWLKKHADITANYIHSAFASECLIGNRYYYNLPQLLSQERFTVGTLPDEKKLANMKAEDATYDKIQESQSHLVAMYNSNIKRLENAVKQFRRGFLSLEEIRKDSEFTEMLEMFWMLQTQCMKYRQVTESGISAQQAFCERNNMTFDRRSIQIMLCNLVFSCQAICPKLFSYEIVHLFDNNNSTYATYATTTKSKQLELSNQGLVSAFLAFSAFEPNMVSTMLAPHIEHRESQDNHDFSACANHIPSRDAVFGQLLLKHRVHVPLAVNIGRTFFMTKNNKDCFYLPVQEALTELQSGKKAAKQMWKKNKKNFNQIRDNIIYSKENQKMIR